MKITIYGKENCENCATARVIMYQAEYKHYDQMLHDYPLEESSEMLTATGGNLPIIIVESDNGSVILGMADSKLGSCKDGSCKIGG